MAHAREDSMIEKNNERMERQLENQQLRQQIQRDRQQDEGGYISPPRLLRSWPKRDHRGQAWRARHDLVQTPDGKTVSMNEFGFNFRPNPTGNRDSCRRDERRSQLSGIDPKRTFAPIATADVNDSS